MEVKYLFEEDFEKWNEFVDKSPQGYIWDYTWWVNILTNGDFRVCAVLDDDNIIVAGLVLPFFSTKKVHNTILTQAQGFLFEDFNLRNNMRLQKQLTTQKEYSNLLFEFIIKDIKDFSMKFYYDYSYWLPLYWKGCKQTTMYTYVIDYKNYIPSEEFKRFSKGHKWVLNKVEKKSDLKVYETDDIEEYLAESEKTYLRQGVKRPYTSELIRKLHKEIQAHNLGKIFKIVDSQGNIHGIEYHLYNEKESYYWLGASDESLRNSGGHTYLTWYAIQYFADKVKRFNFGGSMIEAVEKNFRNFSSEPKQYFLIDYHKYPKLFTIKIMLADLLFRKR